MKARRVDAAPASASLTSLAIPTELLPIVESFLDLIADRVAAKLAANTATRYADAKDNPFGSERAFKDAAREKRFPSFIRRRRVTALWSDCEAAIQAKTRKVREVAPAHAPDDEDARELEAAGVRLRPLAPKARKARVSK